MPKTNKKVVAVSNPVAGPKKKESHCDMNKQLEIRRVNDGVLAQTG